MTALLLFSAILMEFAARLSEGINQDMPHSGEELSLIRLPVLKILVYGIQPHDEVPTSC